MVVPLPNRRVRELDRQDYYRLMPFRVVLLIALAGAWPLEAQWPQFRGEGSAGVSAERHLALTWSEGHNVRWKTAIHGRGWSSPIVLGTQVWVSTATEDGRRLSAVALDRASGRILHDLELFQVERPQQIDPSNSYASPTPAIEPGRVYVSFGSPGTAAIDAATGNVLWQRRDLECNHHRGAASSPILFGNLLIMHFDGSDVQYIVALEKSTGKTVWRTERSIDFKDLGADGMPKDQGDFRKAFSTPLIVDVDGTPVLVSLGSMAMYGYEPTTGKELWRLEDRSGFSSSATPVTGSGLVFFPTGFPTGTVVAVRLSSRRDIANPHVAWRYARNAPQKPSLLFAGDLLFMVNDAGIATALEARTGALVWRARVGGTHSASPLQANGRVYFFDEEGKTTVIESGRRFKVLAENQLDDGFMASPAAADGTLFLRTRTHVYAIAEENATAGTAE
jgi:outer membrane protein assembly factor BamB